MYLPQTVRAVSSAPRIKSTIHTTALQHKLELTQGSWWKMFAKKTHRYNVWLPIKVHQLTSLWYSALENAFFKILNTTECFNCYIDKQPLYYKI